MSDFVQQHAVKCSFNSSDSWIILSPIEQSIKNKIEAIGKPLKAWDIKIYRGVLTGYNEAFIISTAKRDEILANCCTEDERTRTADLIRPILRGRDIKRYGYTWADLWLINTHNGVKGRLPRIRIEEYPALKTHLDEYWDKIATRADKGETPYNLRNCAYMEEFSKPKIVWAELARTGNAFTIDMERNMIGNTAYMLTDNHDDIDTLKYILAFMNSRYMLYSLNQISTRLDDTGWRWLRQFVELLRIPPLVDKTRILDAFDSLTTENTTEAREKINSLVCEIYNFTKEEEDYINKGLLSY